MKFRNQYQEVLNKMTDKKKRGRRLERMNFKKVLGIHELSTLKLWIAVLGEIVISCLYVIIVCASGLDIKPYGPPSNLHGSFTTGLTVAMLANSFWDISGGHFNPVVSIGLATAGKISLIRCLLYVIGQCLGSVAGAGLLYAYIPEHMRGNLGAMALHKDISSGFAFLIEVSVTYPFIMTVFSSTDPRRGFTGFQAPLAIGLSVTVGLLSAIPLTGGCLNPIRAFGPALIMDQRKDHWVYWFGPIVAGILAALSYKYVFAREDADDVKGDATKTEENTYQQNVDVDACESNM